MVRKMAAKDGGVDREEVLELLKQVVLGDILSEISHQEKAVLLHEMDKIVRGCILDVKQRKSSLGKSSLGFWEAPDKVEEQAVLNASDKSIAARQTRGRSQSISAPERNSGRLVDVKSPRALKVSRKARRTPKSPKASTENTMEGRKRGARRRSRSVSKRGGDKVTTRRRSSSVVKPNADLFEDVEEFRI